VKLPTPHIFWQNPTSPIFGEVPTSWREIINPANFAGLVNFQKITNPAKFAGLVISLHEVGTSPKIGEVGFSQKFCGVGKFPKNYQPRKVCGVGISLHEVGNSPKIGEVGFCQKFAGLVISLHEIETYQPRKIFEKLTLF
jgi:hypothetical protein